MNTVCNDDSEHGVFILKARSNTHSHMKILGIIEQPAANSCETIFCILIA